MLLKRLPVTKNERPPSDDAHPEDTPPETPSSKIDRFLRFARRVVVGFLMALGLACCFARGPAAAPRYPGFCLNPATGEAQPRHDELCEGGGIVCPTTARVSGLPDGPGMGFHCE